MCTSFSKGGGKKVHSIPYTYLAQKSLSAEHLWQSSGFGDILWEICTESSLQSLLAQISMSKKNPVKKLAVLLS